MSAERGRQRPVTSRCPRRVQLWSQWSPKERRTLARSSGGRHVNRCCSELQKTVCGSRDAPVLGTLPQTPPSITPPCLGAARIPKRLYPATIFDNCSYILHRYDFSRAAWRHFWAQCKLYLRALPTDNADVTKLRIYTQNMFNTTSEIKSALSGYPERRGPCSHVDCNSLHLVVDCIHRQTCVTVSSTNHLLNVISFRCFVLSGQAIKITIIQYNVIF